MRGASRGALALAWCATLTMPALSAPLGTPIPSASVRDRVRWSRPADGPALNAVLGARLRESRDRRDSLAAWTTALKDTLLRPYALRRVAALRLAGGDSTGADGAWASLARDRSLWQWEALRSRSDLAQARGATARADSLLAAAGRDDWPDEDRAAWLARRVELRLALGDSATAMTFAGQMIVRYPSSSRTTGSLRILEALHAARGDSLSLDEEALAAEVDRLRGRGESAAARLRRSARGASGPIAAARYLRLARVLRELRRFSEARDAVSASMNANETTEGLVAGLLERARIHRDTGAESDALHAFSEARRLEPPAATEVSWERARFFEGRGQWKSARNDYAHVAADTGSRRPDASLRAGLMSLASGEPAEALAWFARGDSEAARFWHGVTLRRTRRASGDSLLSALAGMPGYTFYRSAARDTLGQRGWPGSGITPPLAPPEPGIRLASLLDQLGCHEDAAFVLDRLAARDPRLVRSSANAVDPTPGVWLAGAAAAYRDDRPRHAIRFAQRAATLVSQGPDSLAWAVSPWLYPPAYDSLFAAWPESAATGRLDRSLLQAVAWKESHFDPRARSRSDALGLLQLKRPAVTDVAGWFREKAPSDAALADPALNLRYGAEYLQRLLTRFDRDLPLALAAYNAGPTVAKRWTRLRALGGDALACEEIDYPETQDYVKTILAVRQAYRELRPTLAP